MKQRFHQRHFVQAWKTVYALKAFWFLGPVVALMGSASVFDYLLSALNALHVWQREPLVGSPVWQTVANAPLGLQLTLIFALVLLALVLLVVQGAVVRGLYAHKRARIQIHDAFAHGVKRLRATVGITVLTLALLALILALASALLQTPVGYDPAWKAALNATVYTLSGIAIFFLFSVELLALNLALGANKPATDAIGTALELVRRHPILILEHNLILTLIYAASVAVVTLIAVALLIPFALPFFSIVLTVPSLPSWIGVVPIAMLALGGWIALGLITLYNYATWAELTHRLLRAPSVTSRFVHTARTYIPLFR